MIMQLVTTSSPSIREGWGDHFRRFTTMNASSKTQIWFWMTVTNIMQLFSKVFSMIRRISRHRVGGVLTAIITSTMLNNLMVVRDPFTFWNVSQFRIIVSTLVFCYIASNFHKIVFFIVSRSFFFWFFRLWDSSISWRLESFPCSRRSTQTFSVWCFIWYWSNG